MLWQIWGCCSSLFSLPARLLGNLLLCLLIIFVKTFGVHGGGKVYRGMEALSWALPFSRWCIFTTSLHNKHFIKMTTLAVQSLVVCAFSGKPPNSTCLSSLGDDYMPQLSSPKDITSVLCLAFFLLEAKCLNRPKTTEKNYWPGEYFISLYQAQTFPF